MYMRIVIRMTVPVSLSTVDQRSIVSARARLGAHSFATPRSHARTDHTARNDTLHEPVTQDAKGKRAVPPGERGTRTGVQ